METKETTETFFCDCLQRRQRWSERLSLFRSGEPVARGYKRTQLWLCCRANFGGYGGTRYKPRAPAHDEDVAALSGLRIRRIGQRSTAVTPSAG